MKAILSSKTKSKILKWVIRDILNAVTIEDLLRIEAGNVFIGKRKLTIEEIITLKGEARDFKNSLLWKLMNNNLYWIANFKMMKEANQEFEMTNGRMMTLCIDTLEKFLEKLETIK